MTEKAEDKKDHAVDGQNKRLVMLREAHDDIGDISWGLRRYDLGEEMNDKLESVRDRLDECKEDLADIYKELNRAT